MVALHHPPLGYPVTSALHDELRVPASFRVGRLPTGGQTHASREVTDPQELEQLLRTYYEAYYSELLQGLSQYPAASDIFPDVLLGHRHIVAELLADGVAAIHWPAPQQDFEFHDSPHQRVKDVTAIHRLVAPSGRAASFLQYDDGSDFGAMTMWKPELVEGNTVVRAGWARMDIASLDSIDSVFTEAQAREIAENDVRVAADAYLMGLAVAPPGKQQQDRVVAELEVAIDEFEQVLEAQSNDEERVQIFLSAKRNQILLDPGALSIIPKVKLGSEYVPDFVIQTTPEQYVLVEIERPGLPVLTKEGRPRAELTHAQQQVKDWFDWIGRHSEYARSIMPGISEPEGWVVMGRRSSIPTEHKHVLARDNAESRRITTKTYDDLLDRAKQHLDNLRTL